MSILVPENQRRTLDELDDRLDLSIGDRAAKRSAFWIMLTLSGMIATAGVVSDSTATVIGAMIVAPLSTPILGVGLGIATGRGRLVGRSLGYIAVGIVLVVAMGALFAQFVPNPGSVLSNSQVVGRTSPTLMDLIAAVATGLVGAIAVVRRDVGDVLPGVAIAISLVPPLAVVGVCLGSGAPALALGAFILFASNVVAMIITSTVVLVATGYAASAGDTRRVGRGRAYLVLAVALVVVLVPMVGNSLNAVWSRQIAVAADQWLAETPDAEVTGVTWHGNVATVAVLAPAELPPITELQDSVNALIAWHPEVVVVHTFGGRLD